LRWERGEFRFRGGNDFERLDRLCAELLRGFYRWLQEASGGGLSPEEASPLAHGADRYLRDFLVDILEAGPADADGDTARQYVGSWYIINTLSPTHAEVELILRSLWLLYRYLEVEGIVDEGTCASAQEDLADAAFFRERLEAFWNLTPEGISAWRSVADFRRKKRPEPSTGSPVH